MELFGGSQKTPVKNVIGGVVVHMAMWIWIVIKFTTSLLSSVGRALAFYRKDDSEWSRVQVPEKAKKIYNQALLAQLVERSTFNRVAPGSNPG